MRIRQPDGALRWIALRGQEAKQPGRLLGTVVDITSRRSAEEAKARLAAVVDTMQDALVTTTTDGTITSWNPAAERLLGWSAPEILGRNIMVIVPDDLRRDGEERWQRHAAGEASASFETRRLTRDGKSVDVSVVVSPIRDAEGRFMGISGVLRDIRDPKEAARQLERHHATYLNLIEKAPFGVCLIDAEGRLAQMGRGARALFADAGPLIGRKVGEILREIWPAATTAHALDRVANTLATGLPHQEVLDIERLDTGERRTLDWTLEQVTLPDSRHGVVAYFYDISEPKRQEEHAARLLGELNHRSKNLLALVRSIARQTMKRDPKAFMTDFSSRLQALATSQDLLVQSHWTSVAVEDLVRRLAEPFLGANAARLRFSGPPLALHPAAAQTLGIALHELALNATKHGALSDDNGHIDVNWSVAEGRFGLRWSEGGGPEIAAPTRKGFGSRVLTSITAATFDADICLRYGSSGFDWSMDCPLDRVEGGTRAPRSTPTVASDSRSVLNARDERSILVVEDDALVGVDLCASLREAGFRTLGPAANCREALLLLENEGCDAAVLDVNLGRETSEAVAKRLAEVGKPFVLVSGYAADQLPEALRSAPLIQKPLNAAGLVEALQQRLC